jgi:hypothetical protein
MDGRKRPITGDAQHGLGLSPEVKIMTIAGYNHNVTTVVIVDPAAAAAAVAVMKAPAGGMRIHAVYFGTQLAIASHATNIVTGSIIDGGATGTGTDEMAAFGGADTAWLANNLNAGVIAQAELNAGAVLLAKYAEGGTVAPGHFIVSVEWTPGGSE